MLSPSDVIDLEANTGPITGIVLTCKDGKSPSGDAKTHVLLRDDNPTVHLVRASHPKNTSASPEQPEGSGNRVTFTCPVMSRRHARLSFSEQGNVTIMDLKSLHGTYRHNPATRTTAARLNPNVEYSLDHGDIVTLGKEVFRDDKMWSPVEIKIELLREKESVEVIDSPLPSPTNERFTPNRYGLYSPASPATPPNVEDDSSSDSSSSSDDDADSASHASCGSGYSDMESNPNPESPVGAGKPECSILHLNRLPSLRDLGFRDILRDINSAVSRSTHVEPQLSPPFLSTDTDEAPIPPSTQFPENQLGLVDYAYSQMDIPSSIPLQGGGSPEPEVDSNEGAVDPGDSPSRHSSPMDLSSGAASREASPSPVGAWPAYEPIQKLSIGDLSKQVMNALRPVIGELSSKINLENGKGKGRAVEEVPLSPPFPPLPPHPDECRSELFLPPILSSPTAFEFDNVWQQEAPFVGGHIVDSDIVEGSIPQHIQDNAPTESSLNALSTKIQALVQSEMVNMRDRIQDLKDSIIPLVERQMQVARAMLTAPTTSLAPPSVPSTTADATSKDANVAEGNSEPSSPKQELQDIRDEMLRFSTLLEQVLAKVETVREPAPTGANLPPASDTSDSGEDYPMPQREEVALAVVPLLEIPPMNSLSRKRKRSDDFCVDEDSEGGVEESEAPVANSPPAKRQRRGQCAAIAKGVATAAGFTTLGAVAAWATLAYYI